jgi:hypothetical protein
MPHPLTQECWVTVSHTYTGVLGECPAHLHRSAGLVPSPLTQECWVTVSHTYTGVLGESPANSPQGAGKGAIVSSIYLGTLDVCPAPLPNYLRVLGIMPHPFYQYWPCWLSTPTNYLGVLQPCMHIYLSACWVSASSQFTWGCLVSAPPTAATFSRLQGTTLRTPGGRPASWERAARARAERGVSSAGLRTQVQPAASAAATYM